MVVFSHAFDYWRDFHFSVRFEYFFEDCLLNQTFHIVFLYSQNLKYFGIPRYGTWSKCQFFSPTVELHVGGHSTFVNRQIIRLIQFSCNCAFLDKEELCKKLVVLQLFCTQYMRHAGGMKMVDFKPGWDSLN